MDMQQQKRSCPRVSALAIWKQKKRLTKPCGKLTKKLVINRLNFEPSTKSWTTWSSVKTLEYDQCIPIFHHSAYFIWAHIPSTWPLLLKRETCSFISLMGSGLMDAPFVLTNLKCLSIANPIMKSVRKPINAIKTLKLGLMPSTPPPGVLWFNTPSSTTATLRDIPSRH